MRLGEYSRRATAVKPAGRDHILLKLGDGDRCDVLFLTTPNAATRRRLRRWARAVVESPSFPPLPEHP